MHVADAISESMYEAVFRASLDGIFVVSDDGICVDVNEAGATLAGRRREELVGRAVETCFEPSRDLQLLWEESKTAGTMRAELILGRATGERRNVEVTFVADFRPGLRMMVVRDLTHRQHLDEQLRNASKMEAIGRLAGGVAHDFNNLLMVITSYAELMLDGMNQDDPGRRKAQEILKASARAAHLTRQLLAFSRKQALNPQIQNISTLVRDLAAILPKVIGDEVELRIHLQDYLGTCRVDRDHFEQMIMHLAVNARDAMPCGGVLTVRTFAAEVLEHRAGSPPVGSYVVVSVEDTGSGMTAEVISHLFEPFFSTKPFGQATGMGLAAVYGIVKQSCGYILVESGLAKGSAFRVYLPVADAPAQPTTIVNLPSESGCILLVEDEDALREAAGEFLGSRGYRVLAARDGFEALSLASHSDVAIDVLVTDLVMPGISGRVLAQELEKIHPETRVIYMSGNSDSHVVSNPGHGSDKLLLSKPFRLDALSAKIRETLGAKANDAAEPTAS